jgi:recombinational DNA repair protein (RecF pathway)
MEYRVYTTPALVLGGTARGEANKRLVLLTRDLGVVHADAQRIRDVRSKLRFALQQFALANISIVYGKSGWRVTNAVPLVSYWSRLQGKTPNAHKAMARIAFMVRRLVAGEMREPAIFYIAYGAFNMLTTDTLEVDDVDSIEHITILRLLCELGYMDRHDTDMKRVVNTRSFSRGLCAQCQGMRTTMVARINRALEASQLV